MMQTTLVGARWKSFRSPQRDVPTSPLWAGGVFGGGVSGALNEAPSILSGVPSETFLPCLDTLPPISYSPARAHLRARRPSLRRQRAIDIRRDASFAPTPWPSGGPETRRRDLCVTSGLERRSPRSSFPRQPIDRARARRRVGAREQACGGERTPVSVLALRREKPARLSSQKGLTGADSFRIVALPCPRGESSDKA